MMRREVERFLFERKGYLKKSPLNVAKAIWKISSKQTLKNKDELNKEIKLIRDVQSNMRMARGISISADDTRLIDTYEKIIKEKNRPKKRLFFDLEVSPNIVFSWRIGRDIPLGHENIIQERAIICVGYKWEGDDRTYSIEWNKGDDKELLRKFSKIISTADEILTQNGDSFDIKWLRTRCIFHGIPLPNKFNSIDTLKMARAGYKFNCNKLDYMGKFLGIGEKIHTEYDLWKDITLKNCPKAMNKMVKYCKQDVILLEKVYIKLQEFSPVKKFKYKV